MKVNLLCGKNLGRAGNIPVLLFYCWNYYFISKGAFGLCANNSP